MSPIIEPKTFRPLWYLFQVCIFLWFIMLIWWNYETFWPVKTLVINNLSASGQVETQNTSYKLGQPIAYTFDYCKYSDAPATVVRTLVDGQQIRLTNEVGYLAMGCHTTLLETAVIPDTINPGRYYLDVDAQYQINPFHTVDVHYHTNYFDVTR